MTVLVVDVGCAAQEVPGAGVEESIPKLVDRFDPIILYGFDPSSALSEGTTMTRRTRVIVSRQAAWVYDGTAHFTDTGLSGTLVRSKDRRGEWDAFDDGLLPIVKCFDLAAWLDKAIRYPDEWILKLDCEGAEFMLLEKIVAAGIDRRLTLLLVEWHDELMNIGVRRSYRERRARLIRTLRCPVEPWEA